MVDIWLIVNLLIPFLEIILQTFINMLQNDEVRDNVTLVRVTPNFQNGKNGTQKREVKTKTSGAHTTTKILKRIAQLGLPGFYILFCVIFFLVGTLNK